MSIVLKNSLNEDVTFNRTTVLSNGVVFDSVGESLLDRKRITLTLGESQNVNRVKIKLSVPHVCNDGPGCAPVVDYTQVASMDYSVVRFADAKSRADLASFMASLASDPQVVELVEDGVTPV